MTRTWIGGRVDASETVASRIRDRRVALGMSQTALAGDDLSPSYISLIEAGRREPTESVLTLLAERLSVDVAYLRLGAGAIDHTAVRTTLAFARVSCAEGKAQAALELLQPLADDPALAAMPSVQWEVMRELANLYEMTGRTVQAVTVLEQLRTQAGRTGSQVPLLPVATSLSRCYREAGDLALAIDVAEQALQATDDIGLGNGDEHAQLTSTLAAAYAERGDLTKAASLLDALIERAASTGSRTQQAYGYWNAAITAAERGMRADAMLAAERAAALLSESDDVRGQARLLVTRAWLLLAQAEPDAQAARTLLRKALPALRRHAGQASIAEAETELARCEVLLGRPDVARKHAEKALSLLGGDRRVERARAHAALGTCWAAMGETDAAAIEMAQAASELQAIGASRQAAPVWEQLAGAYSQQGRLQDALDAMRQALQSAGIMPEPLIPAAAQRAGSSRQTGRSTGAPAQPASSRPQE